MAIRIFLRADVEGPEHPRYAQEQASLGYVHPWANSSPGAEGELIAFRTVRIRGGIVETQVVILICHSESDQYTLKC